MIHYLAYGSNLHPARLEKRKIGAVLIGAVKLPGHRLAFHKRSSDGSGKCSLVKTESAAHMTHGALYEMADEYKPTLDEIEGVGHGYAVIDITVQRQHQEYPCFTYFAEETHIDDGLKPYHWYKDMVVLGARYLEFPESYIASIEAVESLQDTKQKNLDDYEEFLQGSKRFVAAANGLTESVGALPAAAWNERLNKRCYFENN